MLSPDAEEIRTFVCSLFEDIYALSENCTVPPYTVWGGEKPINQTSKRDIGAQNWEEELEKKFSSKTAESMFQKEGERNMLYENRWNSLK